MARKMKKFDDQGRADRAIARITGGSDEPVKTKVDTGLASTKSTPKLGDSMSFSDAFKAARAEKGAGSTFTWRGKSFSTNRADETSKPKANKPSTPAPQRSTSAPKARDTGDSASKLAADMKRGSPLAMRANAPAPTPSAPARGPSGVGLGSPITADKQRKLDEAGARAKSYYDQGKANIAREQSMSESDKVKARMRQLGVPGYKKGGSIDGCAIRGKTRAKRSK